MSRIPEFELKQAQVGYLNLKAASRALRGLKFTFLKPVFSVPTVNLDAGLYTACIEAQQDSTIEGPCARQGHNSEPKVW